MKIFILLFPVIAFNITFGILLYFFPLAYQTFGIPIFTLATLGLIWNIHVFKEDFLAQLRLMFLAAIGYYAAFTKLLGAHIGFLHFGLGIQTFEIGVQMFSLTLIAMFGSQMGYVLTPLRSEKLNTLLVDSNVLTSPKILHILTFLLILIIGWLSSQSYGPPIWQAAYASGEGQGQILGNLQSMGVILIGLNFLFAKKIDSKFFWFLTWIGIFELLIWGILIRGGRLEFLSGFLTIFIIRKAIVGKKVIFPLKNYFYLFIAAIVMEYLGHLRYSFGETDHEGLIEGVVRMLDDGVFFVGTISGIASAYANLLHMIENNVIGWQWGVPYLDYFLRTPPAFMYPDRPKDLSYIFEEYGYESIGGFFELSEAYLSFGLLGVVVVPALITSLFKRVLDSSISGSFVNFILLISVLSVFMRGAWYQTFAYYKAVISGLIIYGILLFVKWIIRNQSKRV